MKPQSTDLIRFITTLPVDNQGKIVLNIIDKQGEPTFISRYFTPRLEVNPIAPVVIQRVISKEITQTTQSLSNNTLTIEIVNSGLKQENLYVYRLCQSVLLDCFSLVYAIEEDRDLLARVTSAELTTTLENIKYIMDYTGGYDKYSSLNSRFNNVYIAVGYLKAQLPVLKAGG